ncbi:hypothetical protein HNR46_004126 [Haloferula luteola]|uniref:Uncharacterized protein n=1 Tax=Haloferula luteola TaxID=595692 RepID=A0A840V7B0_9BACT|nr:DUF2958 domain-containing protein [Haloferula luteola]MBB5353862.1 hypothetical protein [Haloferula luteola]
MKLFTQPILRQLATNGRAQEAVRGTPKEIDFEPVVKLFTPDAGAIWLLTETCPHDPDIAFGLCDLGLGLAELGSVRLSELAAVSGNFGLPVERDRWFQAKGTLSEYAQEAHRTGRIVA